MERAMGIEQIQISQNKTLLRFSVQLESNRVNCMGIDSLGNRVHMVRCEFALAKL